MTDRPPRPLAVFYGWPSLVNGSCGEVAKAAEQFEHFAAVIFGDACPTPASDPRGHAVAERIVDRCPVFGYISLGRGPGQPNWSSSDVAARLDGWSRWGAEGVLLDCAGRDFGVPARRMAGAVAAAHDKGLRAVVNAWDPLDVLGSAAELGATDALLAENDVLNHGVWRSIGDFRERVGRVEHARRELGVAVWAVGTSGPAVPSFYGDRVVGTVMESWQTAGAEPPALLAIAGPLYGAGDNRLPLPFRSPEARPQLVDPVSESSGLSCSGSLSAL